MTQSTLGQRLKEQRKKLGLSQQELAQTTGINTVHISRYENNKVVPGAKNASKLGDALGFTVDYLFEGTTNELAEDRLNDRELLKRFQEIENLSEDDKDRVIDFLDGFLLKRKVKAMVA